MGPSKGSHRASLCVCKVASPLRHRGAGAVAAAGGSRGLRGWPCG